MWKTVGRESGSGSEHAVEALLVMATCLLNYLVCSIRRLAISVYYVDGKTDVMESNHGRRYWYVYIKNDRSHIGRLLYCVQK